MGITCIYRIRNVVNGKFYIGSTLNWYSRKSTHLSCLRLDKHPNRVLQGAWNKYGEDAFRWEVMEDLGGIDNQALRDIEQWWIDNTYCLAPLGYNLSRSSVGYEFSEAHKKSLSASQMGRRVSDATKQQISESVKRAIKDGRAWSWTGKKLSEAHKQKLANAKTGKGWSQDRKAERSAMLKRLWNNPDFRAKALAGRAAKKAERSL